MKKIFSVLILITIVAVLFSCNKSNSLVELCLNEVKRNYSEEEQECMLYKTSELSSDINDNITYYLITIYRDATEEEWEEYYAQFVVDYWICGIDKTNKYDLDCDLFKTEYFD